MLTCPRCGTAVAQDVFVCPRCGLTRDPEATRIRPAPGATNPARTPTSPTAPASPGGPPPRAPYTPTPPLPRRPRTGLFVGLAAGLVLLLVVGVGTTLWLQRGDDATDAGVTGEAVESVLVEDGEVGVLLPPTDGPPEVAWTWDPTDKVADVRLDQGGAIVSETEGEVFSDPARVTGIGLDGQETWTVEFEEAAYAEARVDDEHLLGVRVVEDPVVEMASISEGGSLWVAEGEYLGRDDDRVVVRRPAGRNRVDLVALDLRTGEEQWAVEGARAVSALGGTGVTLSPDGTVRLHETDTGEVRWEVDSPVDVAVPREADLLGDVTQSMTLSGDQVVLVGTDGSAGLDAGSGERLWKAGDLRGGQATTVSPLLDSRAVVFASVDQTGPGRGAVVVDLDGPVGRAVPTPSILTSSSAWVVDGQTLTNLVTKVLAEDLGLVGRPYPVILPVEGGFYGVRPGRLDLIDPAAPDEPVWSAEIPGLLGTGQGVGATDGLLVTSESGRLTAYR